MSGLTSREKFNAVMAFDAPAVNMKTEFGYWAGTLRRWSAEGLPQQRALPPAVLDGDLVRGSAPIRPGTNELVDQSVLDCLDLDSYLAKFPFDVSPRRQIEVLEETADCKVFKDAYGVTNKVIKGSAATRLALDYPIKTRDDFRRYVESYDEHFEDRLPEDFDQLCRDLQDRSFPIRLGGGPFGFTFLPRHLMGEIGYLTCLFDDPQLIKDINEFYLNFVMKYWSRILAKVDVDCLMILEDIAYRNGSMISPAMFREFVAPYTRRLVDFARQYGLDHVFVDCDGLLDDLIPLWIETGVTGLFPIEAVNDIVAIRQAYPRLKLMGGVDKTRLFAGDEAVIDQELRRIAPLLRTGGYVPHIDHAVSQDISWASFSYYRRKLNRLIDDQAP